jgi:hypothetical protein
MCWLRLKFFVETLELFFHPLDLPPCCDALLLVEIQACCTGQSPMGAL